MLSVFQNYIPLGTGLIRNYIFCIFYMFWGSHFNIRLQNWLMLILHGCFEGYKLWSLTNYFHIPLKYCSLTFSCTLTHRENDSSYYVTLVNGSLCCSWSAVLGPGSHALPLYLRVVPPSLSFLALRGLLSWHTRNSL